MNPPSLATDRTSGDPLAHVQRLNVVLGLGLMAIAASLWGLSGVVAAGVGSAMTCANFWAIRRLARNAVRRAAESSGAPDVSALVAAMAGKMLVLLALVIVGARFLKLALLPFALGLSVLMVSLVLSAFWVGLSNEEVA